MMDAIAASLSEKEDYLVEYYSSIAYRADVKTSTAAKVQSTPDNSNLQGKLKKVRVIGSKEQMTGNKEKMAFNIFFISCSVHFHPI